VQNYTLFLKLRIENHSKFLHFIKEYIANHSKSLQIIQKGSAYFSNQEVEKRKNLLFQREKCPANF